MLSAWEEGQNVLDHGYKREGTISMGGSTECSRLKEEAKNVYLIQQIS